MDNNRTIPNMPPPTERPPAPGSGQPRGQRPPSQQRPMRPKKRKFRLQIGHIIILLFLGMIVAIILLSSALKKTKAQLREDEEYISARNSRVFHYYDKRDYVYMKDSNLGETWIQAIPTVPRLELDFENLQDNEKGQRSYTEGGTVTSHFGIDVSYFNGYVDWENAKNDGVEFAMVRLGYRGYETGNLGLDKRYIQNMDGAKAAGVDVGVYFYSQATTVAEAKEEAEYVLENIKDYDIVYPVVFDWEITGYDTARTNEMSVRDLNDCAATFCNTIAEGGYIPMVYFNRKTGLMKFDLNVLSGFDLWLAEYKDEPVFPYRFALWQYSDEGHIDGIEGDVDLDICFEDYPNIRR